MTPSQASLRVAVLAALAVVPLSVSASAKPTRRAPAATLHVAVAHVRHGAAATARRRPQRVIAAIPARKTRRITASPGELYASRLLPLVVVDAGHGGADPGAMGPSGTLEKTVALSTAQQLGRALRVTGRYRVVFTRSDDRFVSLPARLRTAVTNGAALMISIHADASADRRARGASVYVRPAHSLGPEVAHLPAHGNSHAIARALAKPVRPPPGSARLQLAMVASLDDDLSMVSDPARQGRFHVLGAVGIPGVLVETGFISNPRDEALLRQPRHRALIARAIRDAVDDYFTVQQRSAIPQT